jgi:hypothetical protein
MVYGCGLLMRMVAPVARQAQGIRSSASTRVCRGQERRELDRRRPRVLEPQLVGVNTCGAAAVVERDGRRRPVVRGP